MTKGGIHTKTIDKLVNRLKRDGNYDEIIKNQNYNIEVGHGHCVQGEIDVYATKHTANENYILFFEIKSNSKRRLYNKALSQLDKHNLVFADSNTRTFMFYITPGDDKDGLYKERIIGGK